MSKEKNRRVSNAPRPIVPVRSSWTPARPKLIELPTDWPPSYPVGLIPASTVILDQAAQEFLTKTEILPLCQRVVRELTAHFLRAVQADGLRPDRALDAMHDLIRYLLVPNSNRDSSERTRLEQEVRRSEEWKALTRKVATVTALTAVAPNSALLSQPVATENPIGR